MDLKVELLLDTATAPSRATPGAAGLDLYAAESVNLEPGSPVLVETGIAVALPEHHVGLIWPRSGWAVKRGIDTMAGVVDSDYRGGIGVLLVNHSQANQLITVGDRIAQLVVQRYEHANVMVVASLNKTDRDARGFGSTGL